MIGSHQFVFVKIQRIPLVALATSNRGEIRNFFWPFREKNKAENTYPSISQPLLGIEENWNVRFTNNNLLLSIIDQ